MVVQFRCPDCEILEVDDEDIGETVLCPYCGQEVEVPDPSLVPSRAKTSLPLGLVVGSGTDPVEFGDNENESEKSENLPQIYRRGQGRPEFENIQVTEKQASPVGLDEPEIYHIACDQGFIMEVPLEMIGMEALCPCCDQQMSLDLRKTIEYQKKREWELQREENKLSKFWLNLAIVIASVVVLGVILLTLARVLL